MIGTKDIKELNTCSAVIEERQMNGPNDLRNAGGMLSNPAPNCIIRLKFLQMLLLQILLNFFLNTMGKGFTYLY